MASPVRLLRRVQAVLALLHFAISVFHGVSVNSFPVTLAHGNSGGSGSLRARFVGVINSIRLKSIMCSGSWLKFSLNTVLRNTREIASQFSLGFFCALDSRLFSAGASQTV